GQLEEGKVMVADEGKVSERLKGTRGTGEEGRRGAWGRELKQDFVAYVGSFVPGVFWVPKYNRRWLVGDLVSGVTLGLMTVPQGIAYAKLAQLPVQHGLYTAFAGHLLYALLGTAREISVGPLAVPGLLTGKAILAIEELYPGVYTPSQVASSLALLFGIVCAVFGGLRIGVLLDFVPAAVIVGFTTGLAMSLMLSQLPQLLGIFIAKRQKRTWETIYQVVLGVGDIRWPDLTFGLLSLGFLFAVAHLAARFGGKLRVIGHLGIAANAILVILATTVAFVILLAHPEFPLAIIKDVPAGFGYRRPVGALVSHLPGLFMSIVLESSAIAKGFSRKVGYEMAPSQEVFALGVCNVGCSFVSGFPAGGAVSRAAVLDKSGVRTPMAGMFVAAIVVASFHFLTPCFYYIPTATLAAIIFKAALSLFPSAATLRRFCRGDLPIGCGVGDRVRGGDGVPVPALPAGAPRVHVLARAVGYEDLFVHDACPAFKTEPLGPGVLAFRVQESIIFPNVGYVTQRMLNYTIEHTRSAALPASDPLWSQDIHQRARGLRKRHAIIANIAAPSELDLPCYAAAVNWIDSSGLRGLEDLQTQLGHYAGATTDDHFLHENFQFHVVTTNPQVIATLLRTHLAQPPPNPTSITRT
ncbi:hypothetical protein L0F63_003410, partial [Massospora cicadina]